MMKLVLVRHGESEWNKKNPFTGWMDMDLSDRDHEEAKTAGQLLKAEGYDFNVCSTSYLKRVTYTLNYILDEMDHDWLEIVESWRLNEHYYGALQGLSKARAAEKYDEEQVKIWRRSFSAKPPVLNPNDDRSAKKNPAYRDMDLVLLPDCKSLEITIKRTIPYFNEVIRPEMEAGKRVTIATHDNSLRALVEYFDNISGEDIIGIDIPVGTSLVCEFDDSFKPIRHYYLGDQEALEKKMETVASQDRKQA